MARPRNSEEKRRLKLRTIALMHTLRLRVGADNPSQFSEWVNQGSEHLGWPDMKDSNKWYKYFRGDISQDPIRVLTLLKELFPDAFNIFWLGPDRIWEALWDTGTAELWTLCGHKMHDYEGQAYEDHIDFTGSALTFEESAYNLECSMIYSYNQNTLSLSDLTEAIALYRLHQITNSIHRTEEIGPYRCVYMCLTSPKISETLHQLGVYSHISDELVRTETNRLQNEVCYRESLEIEDFEAYANDPLRHCSIQDRMEDLHIA